MIIAIDGYEANVSRRVGISRYSFAILRELSTIAQSHQVRVYLPSEPSKDFPPESPSWKYLVRKPAKFWTIVGLPYALNMDTPKANVVFSPTHYVPRFTQIPRVMAIMDLSYLHYPELFRVKDRYQLVNWTKYSVDHAQKIITISEYSKRDIIQMYNIPEERVAVTYPGLSLPQSMTDTSFDDLKNTYGIRKPYILSVGTLQPRKNFVRLIEAFALVKDSLSVRNSAPQLVIVGKKGWLYEEILQAPRLHNVSDSVLFLDFISDDDLTVLYSNAVCFALPSLYEGFGLPVLEAMANKCIAVVSATSSLPEIAGSAGIYVRPENTEDIGAGLRQAFSEYNKPEGKSRIQKGLQQVKKFTWENAAQKTLNILEDLGKGVT